MKHSVASTPKQGSATVELNDNGIIICVLRGFIDESVVRQSLTETKAYADQLISQKRPVYLLIDATTVTAQTSGARSLAKTLGTMGLTRLAVYNRSRLLGLLIQYMVRTSGLSARTRI